jgi:peptidoglycan/LPS O-acetylase OafA/YrhL
MKSFLAATAFFVVTLAISALLYTLLDRSTTAAFARESARVEQPAAADGRLGWAGQNAGG